MVAEAMAQRALAATTQEGDGGSEVGVREKERRRPEGEGSG